ncbi:tRNA1(Val) (adenine(37)-N6)-methyltransferase [Flavobacterium sp. 9AF]|uniref:tRNA1(Val) (adenine(37)-N6)-methyltransferase n=1 Tax=Flavobacterium sp. 9AF TaxID=2653142 RepID=UPI0012F1515E|nr:methyltransferase [Flavobacterium sp. 9AF]VXB22909.1 tRNA1(Val) (adenine(37)-N6)-methyltransferase [Flavobacterium sp. 9AF]
MFKFKQFTVNQDRCAMKIGTDGVLLGAWTPLINNPYNILDIGAGTGIVTLMLAQRSNAEQIDAIEIDDDAFEQAVENFEASPWNDRLFCFHAGLDEFMEEPEDDSSESELVQQYDLIVSNPPFFTENYKSENKQRDVARFEDALPFEDLVEAADLLLSENGIFSVILPFKEENRFLALAASFELYPLQITRVKGTPTTEIKRSLLAFSRIQQNPLIDELIIEISRHEYTPEYIKLTQDFYLKM